MLYQRWTNRLNRLEHSNNMQETEEKKVFDKLGIFYYIYKFKSHRNSVGRVADS